MTYFTNEQCFEVSRRFAVRHGRMAWKIRKHPKRLRRKYMDGPQWSIEKDVTTVRELDKLRDEIAALGRMLAHLRFNFPGKPKP